MVFQAGLHYKHYLKEVERLLKQDPHFKAKIKNSTIEDFLVGARTLPQIPPRPHAHAHSVASRPCRLAD